MKKYTVIIAVLSLSLFMLSCKDKSAFYISGTVTNTGSLKKIYLLEADSTSLSVVDSTNLSDQNKFQFKHTAPYANLFKMRIGNNIFDIIAKNGDEITFSTNLTDPNHVYQISGSDESEKIKEFNKISNFYVNISDSINNQYEKKAQALGKETDSLMNIYRPVFQKNMDAYSVAILKFANENKGSLAAFYAITSVDPIKYEPQLITYADAINGMFKDNLSVQRFVNEMEAIKPISVGHKAPDFTTGGLDGNPVKLSDFKGKYVILDFWASWCVPCRHENPNVVKQYQKFKPSGLNILSVSLDTSKAAWRQAIAADKLTWQHASDRKGFDGPTERLYRINQIPSNFIIDPQGTIIAKNVVGPDLEEFLNKTFSKPQ